MTRHRAKCRLCNTVIEAVSQYGGTEIPCACGEIAFDLRSNPPSYCAINFQNMIGIDAEGNENDMHVLDIRKSDISSAKPEPEGNTDQANYQLEMLIERVEGLPVHAMNSFVTHYDYLSLLYLVKALIRKQ